MTNNKAGWGCLWLFYLFIGLIAWGMNRTLGKDSVEKQQDVSQTSSTITEEDKAFLTNTLNTGDTPYTDFYGANYVCRQDQCSAIEVTAPENSDIVVIIKRNDENGAVISHGYIQAGCKYAFDLPNGTFQPFFYYGEGWNPNKEMGNGVRGGFVMYESFSKDNPQIIRDCVLSYVLQLKRDGNFQTQGSNRGEIF